MEQAGQGAGAASREEVMSALLERVESFRRYIESDADMPSEPTVSIMAGYVAGGKTAVCYFHRHRNDAINDALCFCLAARALEKISRKGVILKGLCAIMTKVAANTERELAEDLELMERMGEEI